MNIAINTILIENKYITIVRVKKFFLKYVLLFLMTTTKLTINSNTIGINTNKLIKEKIVDVSKVSKKV